MIQVSVVLLSYRRPELLRAALASIMQQSWVPHEIIVVDNRSDRSDDVARVVAEFPQATLHTNATNRGFAGGMNDGLRLARGSHVLFTEDDITLHPEALNLLIEAMQNDPQAGLLGGLMLNRRDNTVRSAGGQFSLGATFRFEVYGQHEPHTHWDRDPYPVGFLPGAFLLASRELLQSIGGFWEDLFLYQEDVDLCIRIQKRGHRIVMVPRALIWHANPVEQPDPPWLVTLRLRNMFWVYLRHARWQVIPLRYLRQAMTTLRACRHETTAAFLRATATTFCHLPMLLRLRHAEPR